MTNSFFIPPQSHGQRVDVVLAELVPDFSRSQLSTWLKEGKITVNQRSAKPKDKVFGGEEIFILVDFSAENKVSCEPECIPLDIVYEDNHLMVINKPAGLIVHPGAGNPAHTLVNALLYHEPSLRQLPRAGIIHRLDKDTTGLLLIAKTLSSHTSLVRQMQERTIQRRYITLVQGHVIAGQEITTHYGRHPINRLKMAVRDNGRPAITRFSVRKQYQEFTLLDVQLLTGRTHQIRVHMAYIKHPVVGDPLYGSRMRFPKGANEELLSLLQHFKRQALHAVSLAFCHPESAEEIHLQAPLPDDFQQLLTALDNYV